jgi:hypothetical protein
MSLDYRQELRVAGGIRVATVTGLGPINPAETLTIHPARLTSGAH